MTLYTIRCRRTGRTSSATWPFMTLAALAAFEAGLTDFEIVPVTAAASEAHS
jgi:hypothetical protein